MKTSFIKVLITYMVFCSAMLSACNEEETITRKDIKVDILTATPTNITVVVGGIRAIKAEVIPLGANQMIYWKSANPEIAVVANGIVTGISPGPTVITVNSVEDASKRAEINVTVVPTSIRSISFGVASPLRMVLGEPFQLDMQILPASAANQELLWTNSHPEVAMVSKTGLITPVSLGTTTLTVKAAANENISATLNIMVVSPDNAYEILITANGFWEFMDANNLCKATIGTDLVMRKNYNDGQTGSPYGNPNSVPATEGFRQVAGVKEGDFAVEINRWRHFFCNHGIPANTGDGLSVDVWTVVMDIKRPTSSGNNWIGLITTDLNLINDTDFWINNTATGAIGQGVTNYFGSVGFDTWHRLVIIVNAGQYIRYYLNGTKICDYTGSSIVPNAASRFRLNKEGVLLFGNRNGGDFPLHVSMAAIFGRALSEEEITKLGKL